MTNKSIERLLTSKSTIADWKLGVLIFLTGFAFGVVLSKVVGLIQ